MSYCAHVREREYVFRHRHFCDIPPSPPSAPRRQQAGSGVFLDSSFETCVNFTARTYVYSSWYLRGLLQCYPLLFPIWLLTPWEGPSLGQQNEPPEYHIQARRGCVTSPRSPSTTGDMVQHLGLGPPNPTHGALCLSTRACPRFSFTMEGKLRPAPFPGPSKALGPI